MYVHRSFPSSLFLALSLPFSPHRSALRSPKSRLRCLREKTLCMSFRLKKKLALDSDVSSVSTLTRDRVLRETANGRALDNCVPKAISSQIRKPAKEKGSAVRVRNTNAAAVNCSVVFLANNVVDRCIFRYKRVTTPIFRDKS